jgi:hypothetical protein
METRRAQSMLNEFAYPDGRQGWFELKIIPWQDGIMILSMDVTATKTAVE